MPQPDNAGQLEALWPAADEMEIEPEAVAALLKGGAEFRLIDCREEDEWELTRIEQAQLLPLSEFGERYTGVLPDKNERLVIQCHHGMRSLKAANFLRAKGYARAVSMARGIEGWSTEVDSSVPRY